MQETASFVSRLVRQRPRLSSSAPRNKSFIWILKLIHNLKQEERDFYTNQPTKNIWVWFSTKLCMVSKVKFFHHVSIFRYLDAKSCVKCLSLVFTANLNISRWYFSIDLEKNRPKDKTKCEIITIKSSKEGRPRLRYSGQLWLPTIQLNIKTMGPLLVFFWCPGRAEPSTLRLPHQILLWTQSPCTFMHTNTKYIRCTFQLIFTVSSLFLQCWHSLTGEWSSEMCNWTGWEGVIESSCLVLSSRSSVLASRLDGLHLHLDGDTLSFYLFSLSLCFCSPPSLPPSLYSIDSCDLLWQQLMYLAGDL